MINMLDKNVLKLFKSVVLSSSDLREQKLTPKIVMQEESLLKNYGVLLDPRIIACLDSDRLADIIKGTKELYGINTTKLNSTFWKDWDYTDRYSELEQRIAQLLHYATTYGRGSVGNSSGGYTPDSDKQLENIDLEVYDAITYIDAISVEELEQKIKNMLTSGIALKQETIESLEEIIKLGHIKIDYIDEISNREFMCKLCEEIGIFPRNFDEFTRYLIYLATDETLLIKNKHVYEGIANLSDDKEFQVARAITNYYQKYGAKAMAQNITRYRKLYLLIRKNSGKAVKRILNKVLKLSKTEYIPRKQNPLDRVMARDVSDKDIEIAAEHATVFKLVKAINAVRRSSKQNKLYRVRNGKSFMVDIDEIKQKREKILMDAIVIKLLFKVGTKNNKLLFKAGAENNTRTILDSLSVVDEKTQKTYYIPEGVHYAVPTSEKEFVGNVPYMTVYDVEDEDIIAGITWDDPIDLDIHAIDSDGNHLGFNGYNQTAGITFSGDMTTTNKYGYAAEYFRIDHEKFDAPMTISAMTYEDGEFENPKFDIFVTTKNVSKTDSENIIDQIGTKSMLAHDHFDDREMNSKILATVFPIIDEKTGKKHLRIVFTGMGFGQMRVAGVNNLNVKISELIKHDSEHTLILDELLERFDNKITHNEDDLRKDGVIDLSPSKVTASTFIDILTREEN